MLVNCLLRRDFGVKPTDESKLELLHSQFRQWQLSDGHSAPGVTPMEFPLWGAYVETLVEFLLQMSGESWTSRDAGLLKSIVLSDWKTVALLREVSRDDLEKIVCLSYPDRVVRMYMLQYAKTQTWTGWPEAIAKYSFENDDDGVVRSEALKLLASLKWAGTDHFAKILWQSEDSSDRMAALQCLANASSEVLPEFLSRAKEDPDRNLRLYACALEIHMES